jgi:hypothetical protein
VPLLVVELTVEPPSPPPGPVSTSSAPVAHEAMRIAAAALAHSVVPWCVVNRRIRASNE